MGDPHFGDPLLGVLNGFLVTDNLRIYPCFFAIAPLKKMRHTNSIFLAYSLFLFSQSQVAVLCKTYFHLVECTFVKGDGSYQSRNILQLEGAWGKGSAHSLGPNNKDIWQSGGVVATSLAMSYTAIVTSTHAEWTLASETYILR